jgi:hypothetical protein
MEHGMTPEKAEQLTQAANRLVEALTSAATFARQMRAEITAEFGGHNVGSGSQSDDGCPVNPPDTDRRPLIDHSTLSLSWAGKTCHLGWTKSFRLAERLLRRPNHYVSEADLLCDVWGGDVRSPHTIRSAIRRLRRLLSNAGMQGLAAAIHGEGGFYRLRLSNP